MGSHFQWQPAAGQGAMVVAQSQVVLEVVVLDVLVVVVVLVQVIGLAGVPLVQPV